jgi:hypothetical protein
VRSVNALIVAGNVKNFLQKVSRRDVEAPLGLRFERGFSSFQSITRALALPIDLSRQLLRNQSSSLLCVKSDSNKDEYQ